MNIQENTLIDLKMMRKTLKSNIVVYYVFFAVPTHYFYTAKQRLSVMSPKQLFFSLNQHIVGETTHPAITSIHTLGAKNISLHWHFLF